LRSGYLRNHKTGPPRFIQWFEYCSFKKIRASWE